MKKWLLIHLVLLLLPFALAVVFRPAAASSSITFPVERQAGYRPVAPSLGRYLMHHKAERGAHKLCVIGYIVQDEATRKVSYSAWVYWPKAQRLTLWEPAIDDPQAVAHMLIHSRRHLDLIKDVVATDADVKGSSYLVTRAWVKQVVSDCQKHGRNYTLRLK